MSAWSLPSQHFAYITTTLIASFLIMLMIGCDSTQSWYERVYKPAGLTLDDGVAAISTRRWNGLFLTDVQVAGQHWTMIIDTGVYETYLASDLAAILPRNNEAMPTIDRLVLPRDAATHGLEVFELPVAAIDLESISQAIGERIDGILGLSVFADHLLTFDYPGSEVFVANGRLRAGAGTTRFHWDSEHRLTVPLVLDAVRTLVMVDTGAAAGLILPKLDGIELAGPPRDAPPVRTLSGPFRATTAQARNAAAIGPISINQPWITTSEQGIAIAGADLFVDWALTIDQRHRLIGFERSQSPQRTAQDASARESFEKLQ